MNKYKKAFNTITNTLICYMIRRDLYPLPSDDEIYNAQMVLSKLVDKADSFEWIPVSERLPEEHDSIFAHWYGTDKWERGYWRTTSDIVIVTVKFKSGNRVVKTSYTHDGEWYDEKRNNNLKVIAWMPLPKAYMEKDNEKR